jgi:hypothetical protein
VLGANGLDRSPARRVSIALRGAWCAGAIAIALAGCGDATRSTPAPSAGASAPHTPASPPAGLVARAVVRAPDRALTQTRGLLGARAGVLASRQSTAALAVDLGVPAAAMQEIDGEAPAQIALLEDPSSKRRSLAAALSLRDSQRFLLLSTGGAAAPLESATVPGGSRLRTKSGGALPFATGVFGHHLVVATDDATLLATGPFLDDPIDPVAAPLDPEAVASGEIDAPTASAIVDAFVDARLGSLGPEARAVLSAPFGSLLAGATKIPVSITLREDGLRVHAEVDRTAAIGALGLARGPTPDLVVAPPGSQIVLGLRQSAAARTASADGADALLAKVLHGEDARSVSGALSALALARGERSTLSFEIGPEGPSVHGDLEIADRDAAAKATKVLVEAMDARSVREAARAAGYKLGARATVVERVGDVARVRVRKLGDGEDAREGATLFLRLEPKRLLLGGGWDAEGALRRALVDAEPVRGASKALPENASVVVFVDPARLASPRAPPSAAWLAVDVDDGRKKVDVWIDADAAALGALLERTLTQ